MYCNRRKPHLFFLFAFRQKKFFPRFSLQTPNLKKNVKYFQNGMVNKPAKAKMQKIQGVLLKKSCVLFRKKKCVLKINL